MKFTVSATNFATAIESAAKFVSAKPLMPILSSVKIEAQRSIKEGSELLITGFDLVHGIETLTTGVEVYESGSICANAAHLLALVKQLSGQLIIEVIDELITITTLSGTVNLQGLSVEDYPDLFDDIAESNSYQIEAKTLLTAWKYCKVSASTDETKMILQGVNIAAVDGILKIASTDGHRLTACTMSIDDAVSIPSITIPAKSIDLLPNINNSSDDTDASWVTNISVHDSTCVISNNTSKIITRLYEGKYPDYNMLLPKAFKRELTIDKSRLVEALNLMSSIGNQKNIATLEITINKVIVTSSRDGADGKMSIDCSLAGDDLTLSFSIKYLLAQLKIVSTKLVKFSLNGALEPVTIEPVGLDNGIDLTCLVMPIQLRD